MTAPPEYHTLRSYRSDRYMTCKRKRLYPDQGAATKALAKIVAAGTRDADRLHAYRCRFCGGWHVGHEFGKPWEVA